MNFEHIQNNAVLARLVRSKRRKPAEIIEPNKGRQRFYFVSEEHYWQTYRMLCSVQAFLNDFFMCVDPDELWIELQDPLTLHKVWKL